MSGLKGWVEVFKTGKHPGKGALADHTFTQADLDKMVDNTSASNSVPHVITHESLYSPFAYAQGVEAKRDGDSLYVRSEKVNADFEALIEDGSLKERSVRIYDDPDKGFCLEHIAWLGAEPPAVSGLEPVEFSKDDAYSDFSFVDTQTPYSFKRFARKFREFLVDKFDLDTADKVIPEWDIEDLEWNAKRVEEEADNLDKGDVLPANFDKNKGDTSVGEFTQKDLDKAKADAEADFQKKLDKQKADFEKKEAAHKKKEWEEIVLAAKENGQLKPSQAEGMVEFASNLKDDMKVDFSRDDDSTVSKPAGEWFADFVASLPKQVAMKTNGEKVGYGDGADNGNSDDASVIAANAASYQREQAQAGNIISTADAVMHVTKGDK